jgi:hypothetical protein
METTAQSQHEHSNYKKCCLLQVSVLFQSIDFIIEKKTAKILNEN